MKAPASTSAGIDYSRWDALADDDDDDERPAHPAKRAATGDPPPPPPAARERMRLLPRPDAPRSGRPGGADPGARPPSTFVVGPTSPEELADIDAEMAQLRLIAARSAAEAVASERTPWPAEAPPAPPPTPAPANAPPTAAPAAETAAHAGPSPLLQLVGACRSGLREEVDRSLMDTLAEVADARRREQRKRPADGDSSNP